MRRILIVDDEPAILFAIEEYMRASGYEVHRADTTDSAVASIIRFDFSAIVLDLEMSRTEPRAGLAIAAVARAHCPRATVILLTAHASAELASEAHGLVDRVLAKPLPLRELANAMNCPPAVRVGATS